MNENIQNKDIINEVEIEDFFKIWITKEIIHKSFFENYYKTFMDNNNNSDFSEEKYIETLNSIYDLILNYDATSIRPNNIHLLNDNTKKEILLSWSEKFADEIFTYFELSTIDCELDMENTLTDLDFKRVKDWLFRFLELKYNTLWYYPEIIELIKDILAETNNILKIKKD